MTHTDVTVINGWALYAHPAFLERLQSLVEEVASLAADDPVHFHQHPSTKLLLSVRESIKSRIVANPDAEDFRLGNTLGKGNGHWRRVKHGLPPRYRLFFQFRSQAPKTVILAWLNDESTLRKDGAKTDVYAVFQQMVTAGRMPNSWLELKAKCEALPQVG